MNNLKKLIGTIPKILFALMLAFALLNVTSCDNMMGTGGASQGSPQGTDQGNEQDNQQSSYKNHYSEYANFNPANYVILNESGKPDSEIAELKDWIWLMYAENEDVGEWTANRVKTNKIKTVLSGGSNSVNFGWMWPDKLDRFYLNVENFSDLLSDYKEDDDFMRYNMRKQWYGVLTHENMHIVQYGTDFIKQMTGMRPDICAAINMLTEYLAWFYSDTRNEGTIITADMENAVATQSKYMIWSTDPDAYDAARAKDPSLPYFIHHSPWFINALNGYAQIAFTTVGGIAMTPPLKQASKEDILKIARTLLACRDPKQAGVTDEALWTVIDALRKAATGDNKYLRVNNGGWGCSPDSFNNIQEVIANWDVEYSLNISPPAITFEYINSSNITGEKFKMVLRDVQIVYNDNINGFKTSIESRNMPWCIEFMEPGTSNYAKFKEGKLHIYYIHPFTSDNSNDYVKRNERLNEIGRILANMVNGEIGYE